MDGSFTVAPFFRVTDAERRFDAAGGGGGCAVAAVAATAAVLEGLQLVGEHSALAKLAVSPLRCTRLEAGDLLAAGENSTFVKRLSGPCSGSAWSSSQKRFCCCCSDCWFWGVSEGDDKGDVCCCCDWYEALRSRMVGISLKAHGKPDLLSLSLCALNSPSWKYEAEHGIPCFTPLSFGSSEKNASLPHAAFHL